MTESGRQSSSAPRSRMAAMMRLAWSSVRAGMIPPCAWHGASALSPRVHRNRASPISDAQRGEGALAHRRVAHDIHCALASSSASRYINPMPASPAIAVDRLVKRYKAAPAVAGISFSLASGSITALLGGNGAGKTTTIAMILGLVEQTEGQVRVLGAAMPRQRYQVLHTHLSF